MTISDEILFYNDAFYQAFLNRDAEAMNTLWSEDASLLCIHPGSIALTNRNDVLASWRDILSNDNCPQIKHKADQIVRYPELVLLTCFEWDEREPHNVLLATNGFIRDKDSYKMVLHQAGPATVSVVQTAEKSLESTH